MESQIIHPRFRLSKLFFYILVFFLPFGTRKIFLTPHSDYFGYHIFYHTSYLYLTDLLFFGLIVVLFTESVWISRPPASEAGETPTFKSIFHKIYTRISRDLIYKSLVLLWLILASSLLVSREISLSGYGLLKITEFFVIFAYVRENYRVYPQISREIKAIFWLILGSGVFQAILGIFQYLEQSSLGLKLLGEEFLRPGLKGIAEFYSHGIVNSNVANFLANSSENMRETLNMRAYGTLPHPNVLAGFLFLSLIVNFYLLHNLSRETSRRKKVEFHVKYVCLLISLVILITGLTVTFSRFAWIVTALVVIAWYGMIFIKVRRASILKMRSAANLPPPTQYKPARLGIMALVLLVAVGFNYLIFSEQIQDRLVGSKISREKTQESLEERKQFNEYAWQMIKDKPLLGVGLKNMVLEIDNYSESRVLPHLHQPVHNIFLLLAAEAGIFAFLVFVFFLFNIVRPIVAPAGGHSEEDRGDPLAIYTLLIVLFGFLAIGMFDHYLFTIQQGSLMFWIILGLLASRGQQKTAS